MKCLPSWCLCLLSLAGCAGVGIVATGDPLTKLNDAQVLFARKDRPLPAERLINEAIVIYRQKDDAHGLGNSYREYGDLLSSATVMRWEAIYRRDGFIDKSVTYDNRLDKAKDFYRSALENYRRAETDHRDAGQYDALTNVYINMAFSHQALGETAQACADFDRAVEAYRENMHRNPDARPIIPARFKDLPESVESAKQQAGCPR